MHLLIIGGSDAGISAALRAQELEPDTQITLLLADDYPNFSICGLPYYLSGETPDWRKLAHRTEFPGIRILRQHRALSIDVRNKSVLVEHAGTDQSIRYDRLIIATGAIPIRPDLPGCNLDGVFLLHTMEDSFAIQSHITEARPRNAVIIGAGYIGLEMAEALTKRGIAVTLLCRPETVLPTIDSILGNSVGEELQQHGVRLLTGISALSIEPYSGPDSTSRLTVIDSQANHHVADMVIAAVGVRPASDLAQRAGAHLGTQGAIAVTHRMETSLPDVFAAGDCVETYHRLLKQSTYISLGTIAHKQGRVAGENAVGGAREFVGILGTQCLKVFDLAVARTGLLDHEADAAGFDPLSVQTEADDHKAYYPGAVTLQVRITGDRQTGRLLGAQILGNRKAEIAKRIDTVAAALFQGLSVEQLNDIDLSYSPPFSSPWDPLQTAAQSWAFTRRQCQ
ncbi:MULTISPECIES: FAD-dependent oxidoreductase [Agrobacterium]|uniref:FAD-dependent oxidoreductase n=1 Tax=Agrobacterium tumefaciens TaxID=358 RepID=UPI001574DEEF|nr:FAD-dependent oxidoreductase [Agrobacterium tumefaciens]